MAKGVVLVYGTDGHRMKSVASAYRDAGWIARTRDRRHFHIGQLEPCDRVRLLEPDDAVASAYGQAGIAVEIDDGGTLSTSPGLDGMSVDALRALAAARGIKLHANLRRRDRIIARLRAKSGADTPRSEDNP